MVSSPSEALSQKMDKWKRAGGGREPGALPSLEVLAQGTPREGGSAVGEGEGAGGGWQEPPPLSQLAAATPSGQTPRERRLPTLSMLAAGEGGSATPPRPRDMGTPPRSRPAGGDRAAQQSPTIEEARERHRVLHGAVGRAAAVVAAAVTEEEEAEAGGAP